MSNSRTITREKLETRVLARLRQGLMTTSFAAQFAAEVDRLLKQAPQNGAADKARIENELRKADAAIERLLDRLEGDEAGDTLITRLKAREAERDALREQLAATAAQQEVILPTPAELEAVYRVQVARLETLLTGSDQMIAANALFRQMLGEVRVWGDPEARDGVRIALHGEAAQLFQAPGQTQESAPWGAGLSLVQISVVAGTGLNLNRTIAVFHLAASTSRMLPTTLTP